MGGFTGIHSAYTCRCFQYTQDIYQYSHPVVDKVFVGGAVEGVRGAGGEGLPQTQAVVAAAAAADSRTL